MSESELIQLITALVLAPIWLEIRRLRDICTKNSINIAKIQGYIDEKN
jgi:hypothetical protein